MTTSRRAPEVLLRRYWDDPDTPVATAGLTALSVVYRGALAVRERAYRWGILRTALAFWVLRERDANRAIATPATA